MKSVIAAMNAQPRVIENLTGSNTVSRVIIDAKARYLAIYAPSGKLIVIDKPGVEYRLQPRGCFGRFTRASSQSTQAVWLGTLRELTDSRYTAATSGDTVIYRSSAERVTVDARTGLIRSSVSLAQPQAGVPASTATYSYPASVSELGAPTLLCR